MARHRRYGEGSITEAGIIGGRKRWRIRAYAGTDAMTGRPRQVERVVYGTERAAERELRQLVADVRAGRVGPVKGRSGRTLSDLFDAWLPFVERDKAPNTTAGYKSRIEGRLRPTLGAVKLDHLDARTIDEYLRNLSAKGLLPSTIRQEFVTLSAALSQALRWGWIERNPCRLVTLPKDADDEDGPALTVEQIRALYDEAVKDEAPDLAMAIALGAATGCRRGELLGLQWGDVDWQVDSIRIARQRTPGKGGDETRRPKNGKVRTIWPGPEVLALLERHYDDKRALLGEKPAEDSPILSYDGRTPISSTSLSEHFGTVAKRAKVKASLHSLRHFASTQIQAGGADLATTAALMGNTRAVLAATYSHAADERSARAGSAHGALVAAALGAVVAEATPADTAEPPPSAG